VAGKDSITDVMHGIAVVTAVTEEAVITEGSARKTAAAEMIIMDAAAGRMAVRNRDWNQDPLSPIRVLPPADAKPRKITAATK
jgi:hypothetical protein